MKEIQLPIHCIFVVLFSSCTQRERERERERERHADMLMVSNKRQHLIILHFFHFVALLCLLKYELFLLSLHSSVFRASLIYYFSNE